MKRPLAYITAPWSENEFENTENAAKYCRAVYDAGFSPVCPTLFLPLFLRDEIPQEIIRDTILCSTSSCMTYHAPFLRFAGRMPGH